MRDEGARGETRELQVGNEGARRVPFAPTTDASNDEDYVPSDGDDESPSGLNDDAANVAVDLAKETPATQPQRRRSSRRRRKPDVLTIKTMDAGKSYAK